jgi:hypothetical protein
LVAKLISFAPTFHNISLRSSDGSTPTRAALSDLGWDEADMARRFAASNNLTPRLGASQAGEGASETATAIRFGGVGTN